jgi:hypothetical protein
MHGNKALNQCCAATQGHAGSAILSSSLSKIVEPHHIDGKPYMNCRYVIDSHVIAIIDKVRTFVATTNHCSKRDISDDESCNMHASNDHTWDD